MLLKLCLFAYILINDRLYPVSITHIWYFIQTKFIVQDAFLDYKTSVYESCWITDHRISISELSFPYFY